MNYFMTLLTSALGLAGLGTPEGELPVLTPEAFIEAARADTTAVILDVRRPGEYAEGHLEGAQLLDWLNPSSKESSTSTSSAPTTSTAAVASEAMLPLPICSVRASVCAICRAAICAGRPKVAP